MESLGKKVYTEEELAELDVVKLREILDARNESWHHKNSDKTLRNLIMLSNPDNDSSEEEDSKGKQPEGPETKVEEVVEERTATAPEVETKERKEGIVKLELADAKKTGSIRVRNYTDRKGQVRRLMDENGNPRVVIIKKNEKLNLSKENDRLLYLHLKDHPVYVDCGQPIITFIDTEEKASENLNRVKLSMQSKNIVLDFKDEMIKDFARLVGIAYNMTTTTSVIHSLLFDLAEENPQKVLDAWNHPDRDMHILVYRGMDHGFIKKEKGVYRYEEEILGNSFEDCISWMKKNENVVPGLRRKVA